MCDDELTSAKGPAGNSEGKTDHLCRTKKHPRYSPTQCYFYTIQTELQQLAWTSTLCYQVTLRKQKWLETKRGKNVWMREWDREKRALNIIKWEKKKRTWKSRCCKGVPHDCNISWSYLNMYRFLMNYTPLILAQNRGEKKNCWPQMVNTIKYLSVQ